MLNYISIRQILKRAKIQGVYFSSIENVRWLVGFPCEGKILIGLKNVWLLTDERQSEMIKQKLPHGWKLLLVDAKFSEHLKEILKKEKIKTCLIEAENLTVARMQNLQKLGRGLTSFTTKLSPQLIQELKNLRRIKTTEEIQNIQRACQITDRIFKKLISEIKVNMQEKDLAWRIHELAHEFKTDGVSFDSIVAFGKNSAVPHHIPDNTKLHSGDLILLDLGVKVNGYCSDMTRTIFTAEPTLFQKQIYEAVLNAQKTALAKMHAGVLTKDCDKFVREKFNQLSTSNLQLLTHFIHSTGHGVGLAIHESPTLSQKSKEILLENEVVTVEPGLYFPNQFGVRIEDTVLVKKNGVKILTQTPKQMTIIKI